MSSKNFYGLTGDVTVDGGILNVGNAQLYANTETSNVGIGTTNAEFKLDVHGDANVENLYATYLHGDGSNIENIVSSQWEGSPGDPIYYTSNVGIANTSPVTKTLQVGSNLYVEDAGSNVIHVTGNVYADYFVGDGSQLTGIAASLDQIVDQGNTVSNTIQLVSGQDATSNVGLVTHEGVSISVSNANPTGEYQFGVGSNLLVNVYSSNVLTVGGNVFAQKMTLGSVTVTPAYNLQQITETGPTTNQTLVLSNVTTGLTADANVVVNGNVTAGSVITSGNVNAGNVVTSSNIEVGGDLSVTGNVYIDDMRVAEVASNLVTYDSTTGELMDSGGLFSNKLAVVSEQPPIALTGASTVVTNHGTYTIEASSGTVVNLFDKNDSTKWVTDGNYSTTVDTKGTYGGSASLAGHGGEWVKITMPYKTILRHIKIESTNQSVEDIELVGLNADGLTWTPLKTETGLTGPTHTIIVNATTHHRTYGLIVEKTNTTTGRSAVEIEDLKLFTESFSIDGGKVEMASSAVMGGDTIMDQHGPHGRADVPLRKYPEIVFDASKYDQNHSTSTYVQAGYTVTASSQANDVKTRRRLYDGKFPDIDTSETAWQG
jgi:cytoskeletal protein CcmA (bactofilin family)